MMELNDFFASVGGDYSQVLARLPGENMIRRFLGKFLRDPSHADLHAALEREDIESAFRAAHTLKGTAANLGLDGLAAAASELTEALRGADTLPPRHLVDACDAAYRATVDQIARLDG